MINNNICPVCHINADNIVFHHWYEYPDMIMHTIKICHSCNSILTTNRFYSDKFYKEHKHNLHHILPSWDIQLDTARKYIKDKNEKPVWIREEYGCELPPDVLYRDYLIYADFIEDDLKFAWGVSLDFQTQELAKKSIDLLIKRGWLKSYD